ncbi:MAG: FliH/SctL family protein [Gemmataceae bacterium]|nr:flagellar assembly protein FliH [Gemmata sp.]MDW8199019.1 FliH/SctL family protein [Gemmataceae bacterium]
MGMSVAPVVTRLRFHAPLRQVRCVRPQSLLPETPAAAEAPPPRVPASVAPPSPAATPPPPASQTEASAERLEQLEAERHAIATVLQQLQTAIAQLRAEQHNRIEQWQRAAIELATTMATRLLHERITANDFPIDAKIRDMIAQMTDDVPVVVRLNPADWELLQSRLRPSGDEPWLTGPEAPRIVTDATLARGACHVEGRESMLLSDITRELEDIREELLRSLK